MWALVIAVALVAYNTYRPELSGLLYVSSNLFVGLLLGAVALGPLGSSLEELGLRGNRPRVVAGAGSMAIALLVPVALLAAFEPTAGFVADKRVAQLDGWQIVFYVLIRIPLGTALFEEFAFRGVLLGIFSRRGRRYGSLTSSLFFGLWHIRPTLAVVDANAPDLAVGVVAVLVCAAVVVTAVVGLGLCWLRVKGGGIGAPWAFHATVNSLALIAAAIAHRELGS